MHSVWFCESGGCHSVNGQKYIPASVVKQNGPTRELPLAIKYFPPGLCSCSVVAETRGVWMASEGPWILEKSSGGFLHTHTGSVTFVRFSRMVELTTVE